MRRTSRERLLLGASGFLALLGCGSLAYALMRGIDQGGSTEPPRPTGTPSPPPAEIAPPSAGKSGDVIAATAETAELCVFPDRESIFAQLANGSLTEISRNDALGSLKGVVSAQALSCWFESVKTGYADKVLKTGDVETYENLFTFFGKDPSGSQRIPSFVDWDAANKPFVDENGIVMVVEGRQMAPALGRIVESAFARKNTGLTPEQVHTKADQIYTKVNNILSLWREHNSDRYTPCLTHQDDVNPGSAARFDQATFNQITRYSELYETGYAQLGEIEDYASSLSRMALAVRVMDDNEFARFQFVMRKAGLDYESARLSQTTRIVVAAVDVGSYGPEFPRNNPGRNVNGGWFERCGPGLPGATRTPTPGGGERGGGGSPTPGGTPEGTPTPPGVTGTPEGTPTPPGETPQPTQKGPDPYSDQDDRENKGTGGTSGGEDTKGNEP